MRASFYFAIDQAKNLSSDLINLREKIDDLTQCDVVWDCYQGKRGIYKLERCSFYNGPIVCFESVELYLPQRALRQFGYFQPIPSTTFFVNSKKFKLSTTFYKATYSNIQDRSWEEWSNHLLNERLLSTKAVRPWDCADTYMEWYRSASHPLVANPKKRLTERRNERDATELLRRIVSCIFFIFYYVLSTLMLIIFICQHAAKEVATHY